MHRGEEARILGVMKRFWVLVILLLTFFGLSDSLYLAQHQESGTPLLCDVQNLSGCNVVANSSYSFLFGIPIAKYGVVFYGLLFILAALELVIFDQFLRRLLQVISLFGVLGSLYFVFVQVFLIGAFCIYCFVSALIAFLICICATFIEPVRVRTAYNNVHTTPFSTP